MGEPCTAAGHTWTGDPLRCVSCGQVLTDPDPSTYSEAALRGLLVFVRPPPRIWATREWGAAVIAGLADMQYDERGENGQHIVTPRGHRLIVKAQAIADGTWTGAWLPAPDTPWGRFVAALRERGRG